MFVAEDLFAAVKQLASAEADNEFSHCQRLEIVSRRLGFEGFQHLRQTMLHTPPDQLGRQTLALMRKICERRLPVIGKAYFEFMVLPHSGLGYYSQWTGWDRRGDEVRVPRPLNGHGTAVKLRQVTEHPIYVVESEKELTAWRHVWAATALVPEALAQKSFPMMFNKAHLVERTPPYEKIRAQARSQYENNLAFE